MAIVAEVKLDDVTTLARQCAKSRRMPKKAQELAQAAESLEGRGLDRLRLVMVDEGLAARMARRACQAAPSSLKGALRIIDAMESILGKDATVNILRAENYDGQLVACAWRFCQPKKNRFGAAVQLLEHVADIFGAFPGYRELLIDAQRKLSEQKSGVPDYAAARL